jgi:hypothetical protein
MEITIYETGSASMLDEDERNRNTQFSVAVLACEAIDDVVVTRAMYGQRQVLSSVEISIPAVPSGKLVLPKCAKNKNKRIFLLALCIVSFLSSILVICLISRNGLNLSSGLLLGAAFCFFSYELWLVASRIRKPARFDIQ